MLPGLPHCTCNSIISPCLCPGISQAVASVQNYSSSESQREVCLIQGSRSFCLRLGQCVLWCLHQGHKPLISLCRYALHPLSQGLKESESISNCLFWERGMWPQPAVLGLNPGSVSEITSDSAAELGILDYWDQTHVGQMKDKHFIHCISLRPRQHAFQTDEGPLRTNKPNCNGGQRSKWRERGQCKVSGNAENLDVSRSKLLKNK